MSSIDSRQEQMLVRIYEELVVPLASHPATAHLEPAGSNDGDSFFLVRAKTRLEKEDFEVRLADEAQVAETLERMWAGTPLAEFPRPLMKLCRHFATTEAKSDVSDFVYEML